MSITVHHSSQEGGASRELVQATAAGLSFSYSAVTTYSTVEHRVAVTVEELAILDRCPIGRWGPYRRVAYAKDGVAHSAPWFVLQAHRSEALVPGARSRNSVKATMSPLQVIFNEACVWSIYEFISAPSPILDFLEAQQDELIQLDAQDSDLIIAHMSIYGNNH